jgi:hypothetical protein
MYMRHNGYIFRRHVEGTAVGGVSLEHISWTLISARLIPWFFLLQSTILPILGLVVSCKIHAWRVRYAELFVTLIILYVVHPCYFYRFIPLSIENSARDCTYRCGVIGAIRCVPVSDITAEE